MILIEARDTLMDLGLTDSQLDFSARWLGKQPSYMSCVVARGQEPSARDFAMPRQWRWTT